jgi:hypothetical protein
MEIRWHLQFVADENPIVHKIQATGKTDDFYLSLMKHQQ